MKKPSVKIKAQRYASRALLPALSVICAPPSLLSVKKALFIQPHPDDNQIGAGGTIARLVASGAEVYELTVLDDRITDRTYNGTGLTVRQKEALEAQKILGMKNAGFLGFCDRTECSAREISKKIVEVIREIRPDAVFSVDPNMLNECHEDHIKVGTAVKYAFMDSGFDFYPEYVNNEPRTDVFRPKMLALYYTDRPNTAVDIADYEELKFKAIKAHISQHDPIIETALKLQAQYFAKETPYESAEVFRVLGSMHAHCFNLPVE